MARKKTGVKGLASDFEQMLDREPWRENSTNEQQSLLRPSRPGPSPSRAAPAAPPRAAKRAAPARAPAPPRRPRPVSEPTKPGVPFQGTSMPLDLTPLGTRPMPQFDPMGNPTGPMAPPAPGSSTLGYPPVAQPTDLIPPQAGPLSDRGAGIAPGMDPGAAWAAKVNTALPPMPQGQSAAGALGSAIGSGFQDWATQQNAAGVPPQGPPAPNAPPPGIMDPNGGMGAFLKRYLPPFGGI